MRVFICWLINVCDWVGELSIVYMILAISEHDTTSDFINQYVPSDPHFAIAGGVMAIVPAIVTAIYAALNYELVLSWAVIRWMSPLNIVTNKIFYFFKTLFLSGAAWAAILTILTFKLFPNANMDWAVNLLKSIIGVFLPV